MLYFLFCCNYLLYSQLERFYSFFTFSFLTFQFILLILFSLQSSLLSLLSNFTSIFTFTLIIFPILSYQFILLIFSIIFLIFFQLLLLLLSSYHALPYFSIHPYFYFLHFFYSVGDLNEIATALTKISGIKTTASIAVPYLIRYLFINDIHQICKYFEKSGYTSNVSSFREIVPDAMGPEEWFIHVGFYGNGEKIVK